MKYYFPIEENTFIDTFIIAKSCKGVCLSNLLSREGDSLFISMWCNIIYQDGVPNKC